jgi:drug/metabolite transporter (DMT)-like permease
MIAIATTAAGSLEPAPEGRSSLAGDIAAVVTAACMGATFTLFRHRRESDMVPAMAVSGAITALLALPLAQPAAPTAADALYLVILCVAVLPTAFGLLAVAPRFIPAPEVALVMLLEMVLGPTWVWLALDEAPSPEALAGGALLLVTLAAHSTLRLRAIP